MASAKANEFRRRAWAWGWGRAFGAARVIAGVMVMVVAVVMMLGNGRAMGAEVVVSGGATTQPTHIDLGQRLGKLRIVEQRGQQFVQMNQGGRKVLLTPGQYIKAVAKQQRLRRANGLFVLFNITNWFGVVWVVLGLLGQLLFTGRMVVQWLASERSRRSVVPVAFWWMSIGGATMLLAYFVWRKDIVGVLGQCTGWGIYARNLWLIYQRGPEAVATTNDPAPEAELSER